MGVEFSGEQRKSCFMSRVRTSGYRELQRTGDDGWAKYECQSQIFLGGWREDRCFSWTRNMNKEMEAWESSVQGNRNVEDGRSARMPNREVEDDFGKRLRLRDKAPSLLLRGLLYRPMSPTRHSQGSIGVQRSIWLWIKKVPAAGRVNKHLDSRFSLLSILPPTPTALHNLLLFLSFRLK